MLWPRGPSYGLTGTGRDGPQGSCCGEGRAAECGQALCPPGPRMVNKVLSSGFHGAEYSPSEKKAAWWKVPLAEGMSWRQCLFLSPTLPHFFQFCTELLSDTAHSLFSLSGGLRKVGLRDDVIMEQGPLRTKANFREYKTPTLVPTPVLNRPRPFPAVQEVGVTTPIQEH